MNFSPTPAVGFAVADVTRGTTADCKWEFLDSDGKFVGALMDAGYAPHAVVGGLGAFFGARGQMAGGTHPNPRPIRVASMSEDPANRRTNGGGNSRIIFHLIPLYRPEIVAAYHADFSPVTAANPAVPDEVIILRATGLGPVEPGTTPPGVQPFSAEPYQQVNSPIEVTVGGRAAQVINKTGWPGSLDAYRLDVRVPGGISAGPAPVQITAAWIPGEPFAIPLIQHVSIQREATPQR